MITLTLNAATVSELHDQMRSLLGQYKVGPKEIPVSLPQQLTPVRAPEADVTYLPEKAEPPAGASVSAEKVKRTRKSKPAEHNEAVAEQPFETKTHDARAEEPVDVVRTEDPKKADATSAPATKEKVHQALQQVNIAVNLAKAREILAKFKINRISEVQPSQFQDFIDTCNAAVAEAQGQTTNIFS